jgi:aspartyl/asparaginyl beta-hydroxylase (cupin superfamily)
VQQCERAFALGRREEAQRLLGAARATHPNHPLVLNAAAVQALHGGDPHSARQFIQAAIEADDANPALWVNLATVMRRLEAPAEEMRALQRALALDPRHLLALLQKAALLELQGKRRSAATAYHNALKTLPANAQVPESLRAPLEHAAQVVRDNDAALATFLGNELTQVRDEHGSENQERFDHCIDALLGKRRIYTSTPSFLHFPRLPAWEFYPRQDFPWLSAIESASTAIRDELASVCAANQGIEPYIAYPEGMPLDQWAALNHSRRWSVFYLWRDGNPVKEHLERCPRTAAWLADVPHVDVPGYAPTAFFSILDAKSHIPAHTGVTNTRLIVHLPLVVPPQCRFRVGSETRTWREGAAWVFDDTIEHEAWNDSDLPRAVLIFDVWNPYLSVAERALVRTATRALRDYYRHESGGEDSSLESL